MKIEYSPACRAVVAAVCLDFSANRETTPTKSQGGKFGALPPFYGGRKEKQDKGALSRAGNTCPQCGQGAGLRVLSLPSILRGSAVTFPASPLFTAAFGAVIKMKG
ncbi:MAG: hypothetical protein IJV64_14460, partial [Oscillospiraceae bacterium]|nr:hypothetical protein [Oscillospiraceae bacterium]